MCHSKTRSSHGEVPWHSILWHLTHGQQLFSDSCHKGGYWSTRPVYWKLSLSLAKLQHVFCLNSQVSTTWSILVALPNSMAEGDDNTCLYLLRTKTGLVDLNFLPTCVLHSGTSTCLRVNLTYLCAIWADGYTAQINLKTLSKPMVWSDAYKCCFFFCLLYEMCYFALSLLKHTFKKKTNNVNVYSIWVSFFFCYSPRK